MSDNAAIADAKESIQRYETRTEQWKQDHDDAMRCLDFEAMLALGLSVYDFINRLDESWRLKVYKKLVPYDAEFAKVIEELYRWWLKPCDRVLAQLSELEKDFDVNGAQEFKAACREVQGLLTPDDEFFVHERLTRLRDAAVEANRRGQCEEM